MRFSSSFLLLTSLVILLTACDNSDQNYICLEQTQSVCPTFSCLTNTPLPTQRPKPTKTPVPYMGINIDILKSAFESKGFKFAPTAYYDGIQFENGRYNGLTAMIRFKGKSQVLFEVEMTLFPAYMDENSPNFSDLIDIVAPDWKEAYLWLSDGEVADLALEREAITITGAFKVKYRIVYNPESEDPQYYNFSTLSFEYMNK